MKNILIVDDSSTMRRMVKTSLQSLPEIQFDEAGNGLEALERLELKTVDLMILDLNMPDIHGKEVLDFVRKHERVKDLPVIVLTTRSDEDSRGSLQEAGASAYLTKPFRPAELLAQVQALLK